MPTYLGRIQPVEVLLASQEPSASLGVGGFGRHLARIDLLKPQGLKETLPLIIV